MFKSSTKNSKPTYEEVQAYCKERHNAVDPGRFIDFYAAKGWIIGKTKMRDWKAAVRTWEKPRSRDLPAFAIDRPIFDIREG